MRTFSAVDDDPNLYLHQGTVWHATASSPLLYTVGDMFLLNGTSVCYVTHVDDDGFTFVEQGAEG